MINLFNFAGVTNNGVDLTFVIFFILVSIAVILAAVFLISKFIYKPKGEESKFNFTGILFAILGLGLVIRLIFTFIIIGYREETKIITDFFAALGTDKLSNFYKSQNLTLYPFTAYIYVLMGSIANLFSVTASSASMAFFVKFPLIVCDLLTAYLLYRAAKKYINEYVALILAAFVSLFPAFIFASSVWGSMFSILCFVAVLCFYCLAGKKYLALIATYSLAVLTAKDAIYLFPVIAVFVIYNYVKSCMLLKKNKPANFTALMKDKETRNVVLIPAYILCSLVLMYLLTLPLFITLSPNFFKWIYIIFLKPIAGLTKFGHNAMNIFNLFGRNGVELVANFPSVIFGVLFAVIVTALVMLVYLSRKNRANLSFLAAFIILTLSIFYMGFAENNLVPVLGLLLLSFILIKDKRILHIFSLLSIAYVLNASAVMISAGYLNNLSDFNLSSTTNVLYTGTTVLKSGAGLAVSIICTCITLLTYVYATIVLLDLSMTNKRKLFGERQETFFGTLKNFIK